MNLGGFQFPSLQQMQQGMTTGLAELAYPNGIAPDGMDQQAQAQAGLRNLGFGMLANARQNPVQALGMSYLQAQNQGLDNARQTMVAKEFQSRERDRETERKRREAATKLFSGIPDVPDWLRPYGEYDPEGGIREYAKWKQGQAEPDYIEAGGAIYVPSRQEWIVPPTQKSEKRYMPAGSGTIFDADTGTFITNPNQPQKPKSVYEMKAQDEAETTVTDMDRAISTLEEGLSLSERGHSDQVGRTFGNFQVWSGWGADDKDRAQSKMENLLNRDTLEDMSRILKGNTSEREMQEFMKLGGGDMADPQFRKQLIESKLTIIKRARERAKKKLEEIVGGSRYTGDANTDLPQPNFTNTEEAGPAPAGVDPDVWEAMSPEDRALWQN